MLTTLTKLSWQQHSLDLFLHRDTDDPDGPVTALLGIHVDDIIACSISPNAKDLEDVKAAFTWGSEWECDDFVFIGRRITCHKDSSITLSQAHYATEVILTKDKHDPEQKINGDKEAMSEFRTAIGSLQWLAGTSRPDIAADTSLLQKSHDQLTFRDLQEAIAVLRYVNATADAHVKLRPIDFNEMILVAYGDSAFGNAPGGKSQGGFIVTATHSSALDGSGEASLLNWKSYRHQRVLRSTLAAEAAGLDHCEDDANFVGCVLGELTVPGYRAAHSGKTPIPVFPVTDARSLFDAVHRLSSSFQEKRVEIDIAALRDSCRNLRWLPTEEMVADGLTKRSKALRDRLCTWKSNPIVILKESHDATDDVANCEPLRNKSKKNNTCVNLTCACDLNPVDVVPRRSRD